MSGHLFCSSNAIVYHITIITQYELTSFLDFIEMRNGQIALMREKVIIGIDFYGLIERLFIKPLENYG